MTTPPLSPENASALIEHILKSKDPANVGLRRILKKKSEQAQDFPLRSIELQEFDAPSSHKKVLTDEERHIISLEKEVHDLKEEVKKSKESARVAVQNAYSKGKEDGVKTGIEQGQSKAKADYDKKLVDIQNQVATFLKGVEDNKRAVFSNAENILLRFCYELTKKIINSEVETRSDVVLQVIKKALSYIGDREKLIIRVASKDLETVSGKKDFWIPITERLADISIESDDRIEKGGCIIESNSGIVDARLGVQFTELTELVEKVWENVHSQNSPANTQSPLA